MTTSISRRAFLEATGVATGLALGVPMSWWRSRRTLATPADALQPAAYLRIAPDGIVTVWVIRMEMGQGVRTALPMLVAEDLCARWSDVRVEQAHPGGVFKPFQMHTSGSDSVPSTYSMLRTMGASAREMLIVAAAQEWGVDPATCQALDSVVTHRSTGRMRTYGSLASAASLLPVPTSPRLKPRAEFTLIGRATKRVDGPSIVTGKAVYGLDVVVPGMLYASIERAPSLGATLVSFDASDARRIAGVVDVVAVTRGIHPGVAVLARDSWTAMRARKALRVVWKPGVGANFDSSAFIDAQSRMLDDASITVRDSGDAAHALANAPHRVEGTYVYPFQAHAAVETLNCTADVRADSAELWVATQTDVRTLQQASKASGLPPERITMHCALVGGGFGRRLFADYVAEAVELSRMLRKPVQVLWTRQDDMRHGYFEPATTHRYRAGYDAQGKIIAVVHQLSQADLTIYDSHTGKNMWSGEPRPKKKPDDFDVAEALLYDYPALRIDAVDVTSPVPTGPWRSVAAPATVFARESFIDELASALKRDPFDLRIELLSQRAASSSSGLDRRRLVRVLEELRRRAAWDTPPARVAGRLIGRGVAASVYADTSYIGMVAEVSIAEDLSDLRVTRIITVVDCGLVLNPLGIEGQTESAITWGLSAALHGKIDFVNGAAVQSTYADFRVLRIDEMPRLETTFLESDAPPSGYGEHPVPVIAPAVANAVHNACGRRARTLPISLKS